MAILVSLKQKLDEELISGKKKKRNAKESVEEALKQEEERVRQIKDRNRAERDKRRALERRMAQHRN